MDWQYLLSRKRLGKETEAGKDNSKIRTAFQQDFDKIVFSSAFRRLQNKTQVFPMPKSEYVRNRLTHSLETASVGRSLGNLAGQHIIQKHPHLKEQYEFSDIGALVSAACLAHDIGNPPFGHSGEDAIAGYFQNQCRYLDKLTPAQRYDLQNFEGNAAGFRIIATTPEARSSIKGGLGLTYATYGTFVKYPRSSFPKPGNTPPTLKKFSYFDSEKEAFEKIAAGLRLSKREIEGEEYYHRHPLAYLVEAADDICYTIIDYEDGFQEGLISFEEVESAFMDILGSDKDKIYAKYRKIYDQISKINYLRSLAINTLVHQTAEVFYEYEGGITEGNFEYSLLDKIQAADNIQRIKDDSFDRIYSSNAVLKKEAAGYKVLPFLLDIFVDAIFNPGKKQNKRLLKLIPPLYLDKDRHIFESDYDRLLNISMFVAGMTDKQAVNLYRQLNGIDIV